MSIPYANDEDVALIAPEDLASLCPADQVIAAGIDGTFSPSDRRTLQSASVDFSTAGLRAGHVVRLIGPAERFRPPGVLLGVAAVSPAGATLCRIGLGADTGTPIAPSEGLSSVEFLSTTLGPQLSLASREIDRLLGLDPGKAPGPIDDPGVADALRDAVVRLVLCRRYAAMTGDDGGAFQARAESFRADFNDLITLLKLIGTRSDGRAAGFGTRLIR